MPQLYNTEFRDNAAEAAYPFDQSATQTVFPTELLLDASLYIPSSFTPPLFIIQVDGGVSQDRVRFVVADNSRREICSADCSYEEGSAVFRDKYGRLMGVLVYDAEYMQQFKGDIGTRSIDFRKAETRLQSECVRFYPVKAVHTFMANRNAMTNRINIAFTNGVRRDDNGDVNLYGEQAALGQVLKSINRVVCQHAFLLSHAHDNYDDESAIRLETTAGSIKIGKTRDF